MKSACAAGVVVKKNRNDWLGAGAKIFGCAIVGIHVDDNQCVERTGLSRQAIDQALKQLEPIARHHNSGDACDETATEG